MRNVSVNPALVGRPCRVFSSDVRVRVRATGLTTYPDVSVVCGAIERDPEDAQTLVNPVLVVEVLSPSTEAYDRGAKARHYQQLPSLAAASGCTLPSAAGTVPICVPPALTESE